MANRYTCSLLSNSRTPLPSDTLIHWFNLLSLTHSFFRLLTDWLTVSPNHSLSHSLTHSLTHSFTHSLTHSLTQSHTHSLNYPKDTTNKVSKVIFNNFLIHTLALSYDTHSRGHQSFSHFLVYSLILNYQKSEWYLSRQVSLFTDLHLPSLKLGSI